MSEQPRIDAQKDEWLERRFEIDGVKYLIAFRLCEHGFDGYNDYKVYSPVNALLQFSGVRCGKRIFCGNTIDGFLEWYNDLADSPLLEKPKKRVKNRVIVI